MPIKTLRSSTTSMKNETIVFGEALRPTYSTIYDYAEADAIFRRTKPNPLTATPFSVTERLGNKMIYSTGTTQGIIKRGALIHAYDYLPLSQTTEDVSGLFMLNKARHKISGANQDLGESLVELDQTIDLIKKNLERIGRIGEALKEGKWSKLDSLLGGKTPSSVKKMKPSKRLASGYLEVMFGILPLMSSAHTAVEAYGSGILSRGSKVSARSGNKRLDLSSKSIRGNNDNLGRASFSGTVKNPNLATLNSYGLVNPALMAYQRLPYSFVIDWFVPIGPILGSLTAEAGLMNVMQTYTDVKITERYNTISFWDRQVRYDRKVISPGGLPPIGNPFGRQAQLSIGKLISSVALLRQRF